MNLGSERTPSKTGRRRVIRSGECSRYDGLFTFAYTANGELQSQTASGQTTTYGYDVLGNLKSVVRPSAPQIDYVVDGQNRRIGKKVNGTVTQSYLYED